MFGKKTFGGSVEVLIVGLGNPDRKYENTRHNCGWLAIDYLAEKLGARYHVGNLLSSDTFYNDDADEANEAWRRMGVMAIEMEAAALYMNAARTGKNARCWYGFTGADTTRDRPSNRWHMTAPA